MTNQPDQALDALKQALTEGGDRLKRSRATLARTEALLGRKIANDNASGRSGGESQGGVAPTEDWAPRG